MPAILAVPGASRPAFESKRLARTHSFPKCAEGCFVVVGVDSAHPRLRIRLNEIESLARKIQPNLIHEIRCPIRLERPGGDRKMLQQVDLEFEIRQEGGI